jgi:DNA-directed RNA polymerase specialized sigma24 family protein
MASLLVNLEQDWDRIAAQPLPLSWHDDPALWEFPNLAALIAHVETRGQQAESDRVLLALVRRAASDDTAARTLLQALLPGLKKLVRRFSTRLGNEDAASEIILLTLERIRSYPVERRPAWIAANLLLDTLQRLTRSLARGTRFVPVGDTAELVRWGEVVESVLDVETPAERLVQIVAEAVALGVISRAEAQLVLKTVVGGVETRDIAAAAGEDVRAIQRRRLRAEERIGLAVRGESKQLPKRLRRESERNPRAGRLSYAVA